MVGMARSRKKKVETVVPTGDEGAEVEIDAGIAGERNSSSHPAAQAASPERVRSAAAEARWQAACDAFLSERRPILKRNGGG